MNRQQVREILLASGFKLKQQPDGTEDLNPYCYTAAAALLQAGREESARVVNARRPAIPEMPARRTTISGNIRAHLEAKSREIEQIAYAILAQKDEL
jgi:hypothetical protein